MTTVGRMYTPTRTNKHMHSLQNEHTLIPSRNKDFQCHANTHTHTHSQCANQLAEEVHNLFENQFYCLSTSCSVFNYQKFCVHIWFEKIDWNIENMYFNHILKLYNSLHTSILHGIIFKLSERVRVYSAGYIIRWPRICSLYTICSNSTYNNNNTSSDSGVNLKLRTAIPYQTVWIGCHDWNLMSDKVKHRWNTKRFVYIYVPPKLWKYTADENCAAIESILRGSTNPIKKEKHIQQTAIKTEWRR